MIAPAAGTTVKLRPLLATPPTVTTTFPLVAPLGTDATICVALQLVGVALLPLKRTVLPPCVDPKFTPVIVTAVPILPDVGDRLVIFGVDPTANATPLLATPPTVTTTFPLVAPLGTAATIRVALQLVTDALVPLKRTLLAPCFAPKFAPLIVTDVPTIPDVGERLVMFGADPVTVNVAPLLATADTVTVTAPVDAPPGTVATMRVALQLVAVALVPLKRTVLAPCVVPKFAPLIVIAIPTPPDVGDRLVMVGGLGKSTTTCADLGLVCELVLYA